MSDRSMAALDRRFEALLTAFGETAVTEYDAAAIARTAITASPRSRMLVRPFNRASFRLLLVVAGLIVIGVAVALLIGSRRPAPIGDAFASPTEIQWSRDGSHLAFIADVPDRRVSEPGQSIPTAGRSTIEPALRPSHPELWVVDRDGSHLRRLVKFAGPRYVPEIAWAPDGRSIAAVVNTGPDGGKTAILSYGLDGGQPRTLVDGVAQQYGLRWSPSGEQLLYTVYSAAGTNLDVLDVASGTSKAITTTGTVGSGSWSPDGSWILYSDGFQDGGQTADSATWVASADGTRRNRIGACCDLGWLADGRAYFASDTGPIYSAASDGSDMRPVPGTGWTVYGFSGSPDGSGFVALTPEGLEIIRADAAPLRLTTEESDSDPRWSPDGSAIVFTGVRNGRQGLFTISPTGGTPRLLAEAVDGASAWRPGSGPSDLTFVRDRSIETLGADGSDLRDLVPRAEIAGDPLGGSGDGSVQTGIVIGPDGPDRDIYHFRADPFELTIENRTDRVWMITLEGFDVVRGDCPQSGSAELASWRPPSSSRGIASASPPDYCNVAAHTTVHLSKGSMPPGGASFRLLPEGTDQAMAIPVIVHLVSGP